MSTCWMSFLRLKRQIKCIVCIFRMPFCVYAGCHALKKGCGSALCVCVFRMSFCLYAGSRFWLKRAMKVHCVYIPDVILSICRMSLLLWKYNESALSLSSGCHFVYIYAGCHFCFNKTLKVNCVYIPDAILFIFLMSLLVQTQWKCIVSIFRMSYCVFAGCHFCFANKAVKVHCVYIPDVTLSICRMSLLL